MSISGSVAADVQMLLARIFTPGSDYEDKLDAIKNLIQVTKLVAPDLDIIPSKARTISGQYEYYQGYLSDILGILRDTGMYSDDPIAESSAIAP